MSHAVIDLQEITKSFKKHHRRKNFLTLKSTLIRDLWNSTREKSDDRFWALKGVGFQVEPGETIGLIGSNGSGKSTLLKVMAGILKPNSGSIRVDGRLSALIELGAGFHPEISGRENIYINGIMLGLTKQQIHEKFDEIVDFAELREFIDNPVRTYSSGMFMRLGFAVAVNVNPDILLIDEVLAVGDQSFIHKCLEKIFDFKRRNKTIVLVSHDLGAVEKLCSRVIWLSKGTQKLDGSPREVIDAYLMAVAKQEEKRFKTEHQQVKDSLDEHHQGDSGAQKSGPGESKSRWGDGSVKITRVVFTDSAGNERHVYKTGEPVNIRIEYHAHKIVENPVFGVGFFLQDGTWCFGSNTFIEKKRIKEIQGDGWVQIQFHSLPLIQNSYLIDVAVHGEDGAPFDFHSRQYRLAFRSDIQDAGIFRPSHEWQFCEDLGIIDLNIQKSRDKS